MKRQLIFFVSFLLILFSVVLPFNPTYGAPDYWPTTNWRTSTPEEQGIDSGKLYDMLEFIEKENIDIHSILIVRHGYLIMECYIAPYDKNTIHNLKSVSKSFLSALVGIALKEKILTSLDQKVADILPEYFATIDDPRKKEITLRHLLTMTAGYKWAEVTPISKACWDSKNWVKYTIEMPLTDNPGETFIYNTALAHLMSAILTKTSGMSTQDFANKYLFNPLGIKVKLWRHDPQGINFGGTELFLTSRDMARFGYLYLKHGLWNGKQIVPADWVDESIKPQVKTGERIVFADYGYWWWVQRQQGLYAAEGWAGQRIIISPEHDLVVIFTGTISNFRQIASLYDCFIIPAVKAGKLSSNPKSSTALSVLIKKLGHPIAKWESTLPEIVNQISGKTYLMEKNDFGINTLQLNFQSNRECVLTFELNDKKLDLPVGLDNLYRYSDEGSQITTAFNGQYRFNDKDRGIFSSAFKGRWIESTSQTKTFLLDWLDIGEPYKYEGKLTFDVDQIDLQIMIKPINVNILIKGKMIK